MWPGGGAVTHSWKVEASYAAERVERVSEFVARPEEDVGGKSQSVEPVGLLPLYTPPDPIRGAGSEFVQAKKTRSCEENRDSLTVEALGESNSWEP